MPGKKNKPKYSSYLLKIKEKLRGMRERIKNILDSKTKAELRTISFHLVYEELSKYYSKSELEPYYTKLSIYYKNYIKLLFLKSPENKSKLPNRFDDKRTRKIIGMKPGRKKCPKTYRKYKNGYCFKYVSSNANTTSKERPI